MRVRTPIVNDTHFSDAHAISEGGMPPTPSLGAPRDTFNPGQGAGVLPDGPPKYIQPKGRRIIAKGLTNKRISQNV